MCLKKRTTLFSSTFAIGFRVSILGSFSSFWLSPLGENGSILVQNVRKVVKLDTFREIPKKVLKWTFSLIQWCFYVVLMGWKWIHIVFYLMSPLVYLNSFDGLQNPLKTGLKCQK